MKSLETSRMGVKNRKKELDFDSLNSYAISFRYILICVEVLIQDTIAKLEERSVYVIEGINSY